jgi:hypothetical protein
MPRPRREEQLDRTLQDIVSRASAEIAQAVRESIADEVTRMVGGNGGRAGTAGRVARVGKKRRTILCPVPGCGQRGGGPKCGWFCADHKDLSEAEKEKIRRENRPHSGVAQAAKRARKKK